MFLLVGEVGLHRVASRGTDAEGAVAQLPDELLLTDGFVNPPRGSLLDVLDQRGQRVGGAEPYQKMNVVGGSADGLGNRLRGPDQTAEVFVEARAPRGVDRGTPVLRAENDVDVEAGVGGWHQLRRRSATRGSRWAVNQPPCGWLISGGPIGTKKVGQRQSKENSDAPGACRWRMDIFIRCLAFGIRACQALTAASFGSSLRMLAMTWSVVMPSASASKLRMRRWRRTAGATATMSSMLTL